MKAKSSMILVIALFIALNFPLSAVGFGQDRETDSKSKMAEVFQEAQGATAWSRTMPARPVSLVIEEGYQLPSLLLAKLKNWKGTEIASSRGSSIINESIDITGQPDYSSSSEVIFTVSGGGARFKNVERITATRTVENGLINTPDIIPGPTNDESFITVLIGGQVVLDNLRVATLPAGGIQKLLRYIPATDPSLVILGDHYAVVDENKLTDVSDETVTLFGRVPGGKKKRGDEFTTQGLCIRTIRPPGIVKWYINNPAGAGFSYKPEGPNALVWASAPSNAIDGIYNKNWGCGIALKVPTSCTISWYSSYYSACCNAAAAAIGKVPRWVNPGSIGWENCPLR